MKKFLLVSGLIIVTALPAQAEYRDSDGDVISVLPYIYDRDSDGNVISVLFRDSDGNIISVLSVVDDVFFDVSVKTVEVTPEVLALLTADVDIAVPQQVVADGVAYLVENISDRTFLTRLEDGVNPTAFTID